MLSVRLRLLQLAYAASIALRRQVLATHVMVILSAYRPGRIAHVNSCKDGTFVVRKGLFSFTHHLQAFPDMYTFVQHDRFLASGSMKRNCKSQMPHLNCTGDTRITRDLAHVWCVDDRSIRSAGSVPRQVMGCRWAFRTGHVPVVAPRAPVSAAHFAHHQLSSSKNQFPFLFGI